MKAKEQCKCVHMHGRAHQRGGHGDVVELPSTPLWYCAGEEEPESVSGEQRRFVLHSGEQTISHTHALSFAPPFLKSFTSVLLPVFLPTVNLCPPILKKGNLSSFTFFHSLDIPSSLLSSSLHYLFPPFPAFLWVLEAGSLSALCSWW